MISVNDDTVTIDSDITDHVPLPGMPDHVPDTVNVGRNDVEIHITETLADDIAAEISIMFTVPEEIL